MSFRSDQDAQRHRIEALEAECLALARDLERERSRAARAEVLGSELRRAEKELRRLRGGRVDARTGGFLRGVAVLVILGVGFSSLLSLQARTRREYESRRLALEARRLAAESLPAALAHPAAVDGPQDPHASPGWAYVARGRVVRVSGPAPALLADDCIVRRGPERLLLTCGGREVAEGGTALRCFGEDRVEVCNDPLGSREDGTPRLFFDRAGRTVFVDDGPWSGGDRWRIQVELRP